MGDRSGGWTLLPLRAGKKRKRGVYRSDSVAERGRLRQRARDAVGATELRAPTYRGVPDVVRAELQSESHFLADSTGYSAERLKSIKPGQVWTMCELEEIDFEVLPWDGKYVAVHLAVPCGLVTQYARHPSLFWTTRGGSLPCSWVAR